METQTIYIETQANAPRPRSGLMRVIYNVLKGANKPLGKDALWGMLPQELHKPFGLKKFSKSLSNMVTRGFLVNVSPGTRTGIYRLASADEYAAKQEDLKARKAKAYRKSQRKKAVQAKRVRAKAKTNGSFSDEVTDHIDARIEELEGRIRDLKALRALIIDVKL